MEHTPDRRPKTQMQRAIEGMHFAWVIFCTLAGLAVGAFAGWSSGGIMGAMAGALLGAFAGAFIGLCGELALYAIFAILKAL